MLPLFISSRNFALHLLWISKTEGKNIVRLLAISHYWQLIVVTIKKGQWLAPVVRGKNIRAVCCGDNYFPKGKFKLFNSLFHSVYLVFIIRLFAIADLFAVR